MFMITRRVAGALGLALILSGPPGFAQAPAPERIRATIDAVDWPALTVTSRQGDKLSVKLTGAASVVALVKASLADIKPGMFVGVTGLPQADGTWKAHEVHIFPEAMRGTGEGDRPYDSFPQATMTNATVEDTVQQVDGHVLILKFKGGEKKIVVAPETVIVRYTTGDKDDLKPGKKIYVPAAIKQADGTYETTRLNVGRDVDPPM
jgi:hypothetical protein